MPNSNNADRRTAHALLRRSRPETDPLSVWLSKPETHEQAVVGEKTSRTFAKTMNFLEEMEKKVDGDTNKQR
ncbi:MAG: hypothetical protein ALECFALPRED_006080 [Alectoria fallacina]|uniref:Uncharacterized protein n=1 Tax=Alectoria fallacina TaxID=1903189 RepID=A0A8H3G7Z2_9LECA|nr:MAG: hypothetical protein ALECFALPRED_006080 [Alectoria fallacina]